MKSGSEKNKRFIFVTGTESSGSSCVAGVLHNLGVNMGNNLKQGNPDSNPKGYFEDRDIETMYGIKDFWSNPGPKLREWTKRRVAENNEIFGLKAIHLMNANAIDAVFSALKELCPAIDIRIISTWRPLECIVKSAHRKRPGQKIEIVDVNMREGIVFLRKKFAQLRRDFGVPIMKVRYDSLVDSPMQEINRIIDYCFEGMIKPSMPRIYNALDFVDPGLRHWR